MSLSCRSPRCPPTTSAGPNHGASPPGGGARDVVGLRQPRRQTGALAGMLGSAVLDDPSADKQGGDEPRRGDEACLSGEAAATSSAAARVGKKKGARRKAETANTTVCWVLHCPFVLTLGFFRSCLTQESGLSQREVSRWLLVGLDAPCYGYSCKTDCMTNGSYQHLVCSGAAIALRATCSACSLRSQTGTRLNADGSVRLPHGPRRTLHTGTQVRAPPAQPSLPLRYTLRRPNSPHHLAPSRRHPPRSSCSLRSVYLSSDTAD